MTAFIKTKNLCVDFIRYDGGEPSLKEDIINLLSGKRISNRKTKFRALNNINLDISDGDRVAVIGKNGAGKSTLMKVIAGIYQPVEGEVRLKGSMVPLLELGTGFDQFSSVTNNIFLNGVLLNLPQKEIEELVPEILSFSELEEFRDQPLKNLSSGMRSRLSFSIASYLNPDILLLDEVFAVGDAGFVQKARKRIHEMIRISKIVLFSSHQEKHILEVCDKAVVLSKGDMVFEGNAEEALHYYKTEIIKS